MNKNRIVLVVLFVLPILIYLVFSSAKHNALFLPVLKENLPEIPKEWQSVDTARLSGKITVLGFPGERVLRNKEYLFNLNQKVYNKYNGFTDFQLLMITPKGAEKETESLLADFKRFSTNLSGWKFVFAQKNEIEQYFKSLNLQGNLDENFATTDVYIIDKDQNLRGRKGKNKKGEDEYRESYNTISAADLHNEMNDDVKILLREYRLALKKNNRKDDFRDKITDEVIKKQKKDEE